MSINAFYTQQISSAGAQGNGQGASSASGIFGAGSGVNFMDLIFARTTGDGTNPIEEILSTAEPLSADLGEQIQLAMHMESLPSTAQEALAALAQNDPASLGKIISELQNQMAENPEINLSKEEQNIASLLEKIDQFITQGGAGEILPTDEVLSTDEISIEQKIAIRKKLAHFLNGLLHAIPQQHKDVNFTDMPAAVNEISLDETQNGSAIIAAGLTPAELAFLEKELGNTDSDGENALYALGFAVINIITPQTKKAPVLSPRIQLTQNAKEDTGTGQALTAQSGQLNKLGLSLELNDTSIDGGNDGNFDDVLRVLEQAQNNSQKIGTQNAANISDKPTINAENAVSLANQRQANNQASLSALPLPATSAQALNADFAVSDIYPEGWNFSYGTAQSLSINGTAQLASLVNHAPQAGLPHPATQQVAAVMAKASTNGDTKNITLQLDPPDLGKISVRMEFSKENGKMKAVLVAEKQETYLMLQRDAHALERSLQDAGIDTDGGLSFELSQDSGFFSQDEHSTGGHSGGGAAETDSADEEEILVIETTMDWYVDPDTGLTRYNALV